MNPQYNSRILMINKFSRNEMFSYPNTMRRYDIVAIRFFHIMERKRSWKAEKVQWNINFYCKPSSSQGEDLSMISCDLYEKAVGN